MKFNMMENRLSILIVSLVVIVIVGTNYWQYKAPQEPSMPPSVAGPPIAATDQVAGFPWGISLHEVDKLAVARNMFRWLQFETNLPAPYTPAAGAFYHGKFAGYPANFTFFFDPLSRDDVGPNGLHSIHIEWESDISRPAEELHKVIITELAAKFGAPVANKWYIAPLLRDGNTEPLEGSAWEATTESGAHLVIAVTLKRMAGKGARRKLNLKYQTYSVKPPDEKPSVVR